MRTILRVELQQQAGPQIFNVPQGASVIHINHLTDVNGKHLYMWAHVPDTDAPVERRAFFVVQTGAEIPESVEQRGPMLPRYEGSVKWTESLVLHVFSRSTPEPEGS